LARDARSYLRRSRPLAGGGILVRPPFPHRPRPGRRVHGDDARP